MNIESQDSFSLIIPSKPVDDTCDISLELEISISDLQINGTNSTLCTNDVPAPPLKICETNSATPNDDLPDPLPISGGLIIPPLVPKTYDDLIESLKHKAHPEHPLKLVFYPAFVKNQFSCAACGGDITDSYVYRCDGCNYNLHVNCAFLPEALPNDEHGTALTLYYSTASAFAKTTSSFRCNICWIKSPKNLWVYYCRLCDYGTDTSCVLVKERLKEELQGYKDTLKTYTTRPGALEKCKRKKHWWR